MCITQRFAWWWWTGCHSVEICHTVSPLMTQHLGIMLVFPTVYVWLLFNGDIDSVRKHLHDGIINMSPAHFAKECMGKFKDQVLITPYSHINHALEGWEPSPQPLRLRLTLRPPWPHPREVDGFWRRRPAFRVVSCYVYVIYKYMLIVVWGSEGCFALSKCRDVGRILKSEVRLLR